MMMMMMTACLQLEARRHSHSEVVLSSILPLLLLLLYLIHIPIKPAAKQLSDNLRLPASVIIEPASQWARSEWLRQPAYEWLVAANLKVCSLSRGSRCRCLNCFHIIFSIVSGHNQQAFCEQWQAVVQSVVVRWLREKLSDILTQKIDWQYISFVSIDWELWRKSKVSSCRSRRKCGNSLSSAFVSVFLLISLSLSLHTTWVVNVPLVCL